MSSLPLQQGSTLHRIEKYGACSYIREVTYTRMTRQPVSQLLYAAKVDDASARLCLVGPLS